MANEEKQIDAYCSILEKKIEHLEERERSLMRQLDLARATIAFQAYGIPSHNAFWLKK